MFSRTIRFFPKGLQAPIARNVSRRMFSVANNPLLQGGEVGAKLSKSQQMMWLGIGGAATFGILSLATAGLTTNTTNMPSSVGAYSSETRSRLLSTYGHVAGGLASTALIAGALFRAGIAHRLQRVSPMIGLFGGLALTIGTMIGTQAIDYHQSPVMKHVMWTAFNGAIALSLCPLGIMGGALLYRAALATGAIMGSLSLVAATAPSDQFLSWGGPLSIGLGVVFAASIGQFFFPASSLLYNVTLYGGLGVFSLFTLYDTQVLLARVNDHSQQFDPVNASMGLYMDTINIFIRMVMIMGGGQRRR